MEKEGQTGKRHVQASGARVILYTLIGVWVIYLYEFIKTINTCIYVCLLTKYMLIYINTHKFLCMFEISFLLGIKPFRTGGARDLESSPRSAINSSNDFKQIIFSGPQFAPL